MSHDPRSTAATPRPLPSADELAALDVPGLLARLDRAAAAVDAERGFAALFPADDARDLLADPRFARVESLLRNLLRALMLTSSLRDLPEAARVHPAVQARVWSALDDMDAALAALTTTLSTLTASERAAVTRAMRDEPALVSSVLDALDAEACRAGVPDERRAHLREMSRQACFRLRQSTSGFIDEYAEKLARARPWGEVEAERWLALRSGSEDFTQERAWQLAVHAQWNELLAAPASGAPPQNPDGPGGSIYRPLPPPPPAPPRRGTRALQAAGVLFGLGLVTGAAGGALVSSGDSDQAINGMFVLTGAALLAVAGTICLLVGAILRWRDPR